LVQEDLQLNSPVQTTIAEGVRVKGNIHGRVTEIRPLPPKGKTVRYVLTSVQNNTLIHEAVWLNVLAMAEHYDAEVMVGTYTYNKSAFGIKSVKRGSQVDHDDYVWYDEQVLEHINDERVQLAPGLVWCGELNILPTSLNPLSQMEAYNGRNSNIVPHAKYAMTGVAAVGSEGCKLNFTTGTVTQRNYIQKRIGILSEQYHGYGALLVEVCGDGNWFVRQLQAAEDASIRDFDLKAAQGEVTTGNPIAAISWGDVHVRVIDPVVRELAWGKGGMLDTLKPAEQFVHDILDQRSRNHHEIKDPISTYRKWKDGKESVSDEVAEVAEWLRTDAYRPWCKTIVVPSNHHEALERWVKDADWKTDPVNAMFYLEAAKALLLGERDLFAWAIAHTATPGPWSETVEFLETDESYIVAGVELGQHGHLGLNGARGNHKSFVKLGRPATTGHEHTAAIHLWNWVAGTSTKLRIGYNRGPSSWSHSHVIQYPEGTRSMVTMFGGKWRG
jgi:hypothetical protein